MWGLQEKVMLHTITTWNLCEIYSGVIPAIVFHYNYTAEWTCVCGPGLRELMWEQFPHVKDFLCFQKANIWGTHGKPVQLLAAVFATQHRVSLSTRGRNIYWDPGGQEVMDTELCGFISVSNKQRELWITSFTLITVHGPRVVREGTASGAWPGGVMFVVVHME